MDGYPAFESVEPPAADDSGAALDGAGDPADLSGVGDNSGWFEVGTPDGDFTVVDLAPAGVPDSHLAFDTTGQATVVDGGPVVWNNDPVLIEPEPDPVIDGGPTSPGTDQLTITLSDGTVIDAGVPTLDLWGDDGVLDTVDTAEGDSRMQVSDVDGIPGADLILMTEGDETTMFVERDPLTGEWSDVAEAPSTVTDDPTTQSRDVDEVTSAEIEVPAQFQVTVDPSANPAMQIAMRMEATTAEAAADLWSAAYPGDPWPVDDETGQPYHPKILLAVIANDDALPDGGNDVRSVARSVLDSSERALDTIINPEKAGDRDD